MNRRLIVVAYGGSPESAAALSGVSRRLEADIATVTLDFGQRLDFEQVREQALMAGAIRAHVIDARTELAADVLRPALMAGAFEAGPLTVAVTRPLIAWHVAAVARMEAAAEVAHGAVGEDRARLERLISELAPELVIHALAQDSPISTGYSVEHLWGRQVAWPVCPPAKACEEGPRFTRTHAPEICGPEPAVVEIAIDRGVPVSVNGVALDVDELVEVVDTIAGDHGVGRFDATVDGVRVIAESPAAVVLSMAVDSLASAGLERDMLAHRQRTADGYRSLLDQGGWYSPRRVDLDAVVGATIGALSGAVRLLLLRGQCRVVDQQLAPVNSVIEATAV